MLLLRKTTGYLGVRLIEECVEYYIIRFKDNKVEKVYPIAGSIKESTLNEIKLVRTMEETIFYYPQMIKNNIVDFFNLKAAEESYYNKVGVAGLLNSSDIQIDQNRVVLNILTSFRAYVDNVLHMLNSQFGSDCEPGKKFKEFQSLEFDSHFEYRFMSKYRNFVQHTGLPIHETLTDEQELRKGRFKYIPILNSKKLLDQWDGWGKVKPDLERREIIDLFEVIKNFDKQIDSLHMNFVNFIFSSQLYKLDNLIRHTRNVQVNFPDWAVGVLIPGQKDFQIQMFPEKFIKSYMNIVKA